MSKKRRSLKELLAILDYREDGGRDSRVPSAYLEWRRLHGLPYWCDLPTCQLHRENPMWNGAPAELRVDHIDGCNFNNRTKNLRLLCVACDAQQPTSGGRNRGRIQRSPTGAGYSMLDRETGLRHYRMPVKPGHFVLTGGEVAFRLVNPVDDEPSAPEDEGQPSKPKSP